MTLPAQPAAPPSVDGLLERPQGTRMRAGWPPRQDLVAAAYVVLALAALGAVLGVLWQWWSPPGGLGYVVAPHEIQPDETEAFIAGDGRFAVICAATGLVGALATWSVRSTRGPATALALGVGGLLGSGLTGGVGHLLAGGNGDGKTNTLLRQLPLSVHMRGLWLLEATVAVLVYSVCAAFAAQDDLGRPEPRPVSVGVWDEVQGAGGHRDGPGSLHQSDLAPQ